MPERGGSHGSRRLIQISKLGTSSVGASSRQPSLISTSPSASRGENSRDPHVGQKLRPSQHLVSPVDSKLDHGHTANGMKTLPVSFLHDVQWQSPTRTGSPRS